MLAHYLSAARKEKTREAFPVELIQHKIFMVRGHKVRLSPHLAKLYGVEVRALIQAVKRNKDRFPNDFMFQLNDAEFKNLKSQILTSSWGGVRSENIAHLRGAFFTHLVGVKEPKIPLLINLKNA